MEDSSSSANRLCFWFCIFIGIVLVIGVLIFAYYWRQEEDTNPLIKEANKILDDKIFDSDKRTTVKPIDNSEYEVTINKTPEGPIKKGIYVSNIEITRDQNNKYLNLNDKIGGNIWFQKSINLITNNECKMSTEDIKRQLKEIKKLKIGLINLFVQNSSVVLTIRDRKDTKMSTLKFLKKIDNTQNSQKNQYEFKNIDLSSNSISLNIPINNGNIALGEMQELWLCDFSENTQSVNILATVQGVDS
jgi:thiamine phosphate synthase YjbQ (UPF0047 family)